jgi:hypothetical protein
LTPERAVLLSEGKPPCRGAMESKLRPSVCGARHVEARFLGAERSKSTDPECIEQRFGLDSLRSSHRAVFVDRNGVLHLPFELQSRSQSTSPKGSQMPCFCTSSSTKTRCWLPVTSLHAPAPPHAQGALTRVRTRSARGWLPKRGRTAKPARSNAYEES